MDTSDLPTLRKMLANPLYLKPRQRETAQKALKVPNKMTEILAQGFGYKPLSRLEQIALDHRREISARDRRKPDPPSEIEREMNSLGDRIGRLRKDIRQLQERPEYMELIQAEADEGSGWMAESNFARTQAEADQGGDETAEHNDEEPYTGTNRDMEESTPYIWFPIFRKRSDDSLALFDDEFRCSELGILKRFIKRVAQRAGEAKEAPAGKRETYTTRNENLVRSLCRLVADVGGAKSHVLPIASVIDEWATGRPTVSDLGTSTLRRVCRKWPPPGGKSKL